MFSTPDSQNAFSLDTISTLSNTLAQGSIITTNGLHDPFPSQLHSASSSTLSIENSSSGVFTVGATGQVSFDYLFDGGMYQGEVAIFDLTGMDRYLQVDADFFAREAALRAMTNSDLGHIVISDQTQGARFSGTLPYEGDFNSGTYTGAKTFSMRPGEHFGIMLVPNGTIAEVLHSQNIDDSLSPLFSISTVNPNSSTHFAQLVSPSDCGLSQTNHNIFGIEDLRLDGTSDREYNDIIFQLQGATGDATSLDQVIDPSHEWRNSETGQKLMQFAAKSFDTAGNSFETSTSDPSNLLRTEVDWGEMEYRQDQTGLLSATNKADVYHFHTTGGFFNLAMTGTIGNANLQLLDSQGNVFASSTHPGNHDQLINFYSIPQGDYYVRVYGDSGSTPYNLELSMLPPAMSSAIAAENEIGKFKGTRTFDGSLDRNNTTDIYHFTLDTPGYFNLALTGLTDDVRVGLINAQSNGYAATSSNTSSTDTSINIADLAAGDYYVYIFTPSGGNSNYKLLMSTDSTLLPQYPDLGTLNGTRTFSGYLTDYNSQHVYHFHLDQDSLFDLTLTGLTNPANVLLVKDTNGNSILDPGELAYSANAGGLLPRQIPSMFEEAGDYFVIISQEGLSTSSTGYRLSLSTGDWCSTHLHDIGIIGLVRDVTGDENLDRNDMIKILQEAGNDGIVNKTEYHDLQSLVSEAPYSMPDHVKILANKVVNGDPANDRSRIGNLHPNSGYEQLKNLVDKWFFGAYLPIAISNDQRTRYEYQEIESPLFKDGLASSISYKDIKQQDLGDCYFLASLGAVAERSPGLIRSMFIDNGDNTWTVRFYHDGKPDYITVNRDLPTDANGNAVFAGWDNGLWVALAEKAYAQANESGWIGQDNTRSYNGYKLSSKSSEDNDGGINGGQGNNALYHLTGLETDRKAMKTLAQHISGGSRIEEIKDAVRNHKMVVINTGSFPADNITGAHSYTLVDYNPATDKFTLYNPHGRTVPVDSETLIQNFGDWDFVVTDSPTNHLGVSQIG
jgi:hypothetical protein